MCACVHCVHVCARACVRSQVQHTSPYSSMHLSLRVGLSVLSNRVQGVSTAVKEGRIPKSKAALVYSKHYQVCRLLLVRFGIAISCMLHVLIHLYVRVPVCVPVCVCLCACVPVCVRRLTGTLQSTRTIAASSLSQRLTSQGTQPAGVLAYQTCNVRKHRHRRTRNTREHRHRRTTH